MQCKFCGAAFVGEGWGSDVFSCGSSHHEGKWKQQPECRDDQLRQFVKAEEIQMRRGWNVVRYRGGFVVWLHFSSAANDPLVRPTPREALIAAEAFVVEQERKGGT